MNDALEFALSLAKAAEAEIMPIFRTCEVSLKSDGSEVTEADKRAEEVMRNIIAKKLPQHQVLGEEYGGPTGPTDEPLWVLDPIDGTASFAVGLPIFGTLIGYLEHGEPQVGVIHFPAMGETIYAVRGEGCWVRVLGHEPKQVHASGIKSLKEAYVSACSVSPSDIAPPPSGPCYQLSALIAKSRKFRMISDCVQHALVAQGRIDVAVDAIMNPWDIAALVPCVEAAGGVVTDLSGRREQVVWSSSLLSSSTRNCTGKCCAYSREILFMPSKKTSRKPRAPRKAQARSRGLEAMECRLDVQPKELESLIRAAESEGAAIVGTCKDPLGGKPLAVAILPIDAVEPTPFQRDLSEAHHKRLAAVIQKTGLFLDPIIVVPAPNKGFWTPNGRHRLEAMRRLGAKSITALLVPDRQIAWQILALNTEKAHNLKEKSLEVARIYRGLIEEDDSRKEIEFADYLEEAAFITLGFCYEKKPMFAGGAYHPILRRVEEFSDDPLRKAVKEHEHRSAMVMELDENVATVVKQLKEQGLVSPYLRAFVVARVNPLRWAKEIPSAESVLKTMMDRVAKFKTDKIRPQDLVRVGGAPDEE